MGKGARAKEIHGPRSAQGGQQYTNIRSTKMSRILRTHYRGEWHFSNDVYDDAFPYRKDRRKEKCNTYLPRDATAQILNNDSVLSVTWWSIAAI